MLRSIFIFGVLAIGSVFAFRSALYAAALYLWIAYFRPESWAWTSLFASLNLSYYAGVFLVIRALLAGVSWRATWRSALLLLFLVLTLVSTFAGVYPDHSWIYWQAFAKTIIVSYLLTVIIKTEADFRLILFVIALSLGFEATKQGWAQLILNPGGQNNNPIPFLGDNNLVAVGVAMLVPVMSALAETSGGWQKRALQFLNVGIVYRAISTYSRGGFLSIGAVAAMSFWRSKHKVRAVIAGAIVAALIVPVLPPEFWARMSTITVAAEERDNSQEGRVHFWQIAIAMANDRPFLGIGHAAYELSYDEYDTTGGRYGTRRSVHSAWFGVLAESGYIGLALFVTIVLGAWWACRRVRHMAKRKEIPASLGHYATALESALIAFAVGGSFVPFQYVEMLWHFFALTIALERVAATEAAIIRDRQAREAKTVAPAATPAEEFAWA
jgi:probable O-glycosylation ligase (exosortase A-associated)